MHAISIRHFHSLPHQLSPILFIYIYIYFKKKKGEEEEEEAICGCLSTHGLPLCWVLFVLQGIGLPFGVGFAPLFSEPRARCSTNCLNQPFCMPKPRASSSQSSKARATSSQPTGQQRELILENTFAIQTDFTSLKATKWVVKEFKCRGLTALFQPVSPTVYERLVQ